MPSASMSGMRACGSNPPLRPSLYSIASAATTPAARRPRQVRRARLAADDLALDEQALLAVISVNEARPPVAERRIDVVVPQIERFEDVAVGVDDVVSRCS